METRKLTAQDISKFIDQLRLAKSRVWQGYFATHAMRPMKKASSRTAAGNTLVYEVSLNGAILTAAQWVSWCHERRVDGYLDIKGIERMYDVSISAARKLLN